MNEEASVRKFAYRYPRLSTSLPIDFILDETITLGVCESLSECGMSARFSDELPAGSMGRVTLYFDKRSISVYASISNTEEGRSTMQFIFSSAAEQNAMRTLIELIRLGPIT